MKLLTKQHKLQLKLNSKKRKPIAYVKLFNPSGIGTWYLSELDENNIAYGLACVHEKELGYVDLNELKEIKTPPFGLGIERDKWFKPTPLKDCRND
tara:strand:+ start:899 stop:1186 length:288 start_codon:yes stop_codon:yes gene_type:complete